MTLAMSSESVEPRRYTVKVNGKVVGKAVLKTIPVDAIQFDSAYQRALSRPWIQQHLPFDEQLAGAIVLSSRAGGPYCIDGGHRVGLAKESHVPTINAYIIDGLTQKDEARLFTQYQRERRALTAWALYRADLVAEDPETIDVQGIVLRAGYRIDEKASNDSIITAVDSLRYIYRHGNGAELLARTLELVKRIWYGEPKALSGQSLKGLALFLSFAVGQPGFRSDRLETVMQEYAPSKVLRLSQAIAADRNAASTTPANVAETLNNLYIKKLGRNDPPFPPFMIGAKKRPAARGKGKSA